MTNLQKRILTSIIIFPVSIFFIIKGGDYIVSFLYAILILGNFEVFSVFKRKTTIIFLDLILVITLLSILHMRNDTISSFGANSRPLIPLEDLPLNILSFLDSNLIHLPNFVLKIIS